MYKDVQTSFASSFASAKGNIHGSNIKTVHGHIFDRCHLGTTVNQNNIFAAKHLEEFQDIIWTDETKWNFFGVQF